MGAWGGNAAVTQDVGSPRRRALGHRSCRPTDRPATDRPVIVRAVSTVASAVPSLSGRLRAPAYGDSHRTREAFSGGSESSATWNHQRDERLQRNGLRCERWLGSKAKEAKITGGRLVRKQLRGRPAEIGGTGRNSGPVGHGANGAGLQLQVLGGIPARGSADTPPARQAERSWP